MWRTATTTPHAANPVNSKTTHPGEERQSCACGMGLGVVALAGLCPLSAAALTSHAEVFVDPVAGDDSSSFGLSSAPVQSVHAAASVVRKILRQSPGTDVTVQLFPGLHHVGQQPLALGELDGGVAGSWVVWRSLHPELPATVGAPIRVTGWKAHPTIKGAMVAPLPSNVTKGSALRQLWVNGERALRTKVLGHGRQQGDNKNGYCLNLTNSTPTRYACPPRSALSPLEAPLPPVRLPKLSSSFCMVQSVSGRQRLRLLLRERNRSINLDQPG